ncbi:DDE-type integrase/transposase/recombinase [Legionella longbeachae]|nr:DDE-type integrase/transposase/recombinase [Legionella longbeachae]UAK47081.1 DDE-type integrase/transposase/recombinase [Legionella longbeachae]HBD7396992.1 IS6 family transposase [Legionella pneumophila]
MERGLKVDHSTIYRWVIEYAPLLEEAFRKRHKHPVGGLWRVDETYIKVLGQWVYLFMALQHSLIQHFFSLSLNNFSRQNLAGLKKKWQTQM